MSGSQKIIKIFSIIAIVLGVFSLLIGCLSLSVCSEVLNSPEMTSSIEGYTEETGYSLLGGALLTTLSGIFNIILGVLGLRAAKDAGKIGPFFAVVLVEVLLSAAGIISSIANGSFSPELFAGIVIPVILFICARNVRKQRDAAE